MITDRNFSLPEVAEVNILSQVRLIGRHDLNHVSTQDNLRAQFEISGDLKGTITCYLCLDGHELTEAERNYVFPLFTESMNILLGKQLCSTSGVRARLSPPKISMIPVSVSSASKTQIQKYELELQTISFTILAEYGLTAIN